MSDDAKRKERIDKLDELTDLWLDDLLNAARNGSMSSADRKLIGDFLRQNGLNLDPNTLPQSLKDQLTSRPEFHDEDGDVLPFRNTAAR